MRAITLIILFIFLPACIDAQCGSPSSTADSNVNSKKQLAHWEQTAYKLHQDGSFDEELECRMHLSKLEWQLVAQSPRALDKYDLWGLLAENDRPLAFLLEGKHRWDEAENIYRHSQQQLAHLRVAGNDVKSDNELGLAHLLFSVGKTEEAQKICSHWKNRVRHNADFAINAVKTNVPTPPLYDTPEVEIGRWDIACGEPQAGEDLLRTQIVAHPDMLAPYTALENYFLETGAFPKALEIELEERHLWNRPKK
jgi:hypothetical protein